MDSKWKAVLQSIGFTAGAAALGAWLSAGSMEQYENIYKPPLAPPGWLFPIVWTILYVLMAIASYMIALSLDPAKEEALNIYRWQLIVNIAWPVLFFRFEAYWLAFALLIILWLLIKITIDKFSALNKTAGRLLIPYLLWVTFAGYLNLAYALQ